MPGAVFYGPGRHSLRRSRDVESHHRSGRTKPGCKSFMSAGRLRDSQKPALQLLAHPIGSQS